MNNFTELALHGDIQRGIRDMGFTEPTPIQRDTIPPALQGRDILACAMTGSGKTAAFALPIIHRLLRKKRHVTRALVLTPTRELAAQITEHFTALAAHTPIRCASIFGGVSMGPQEKALRRGTDIIVATPGRLLDHFQYPYARMAGMEILVIDEADRMLDMGFLPDVKRILQHIPKASQTLFFSATMPQPIVALSRDILSEPVTVNIDRVSAPATGVNQTVYPARSDQKPSLLLELLNREGIKNVLVFTRTKIRANRLATFLQRNGVTCERIHGNRSQNQRTDALAGFKKGRFQVLVATDIAARGIDVEGLSHVINFDVPDVPESYIHRVGRTARAAMTGDALTFVSADEESAFRAIERALGAPLPRVRLEGFDYETQRTITSAISRGTPSGGGRGKRRSPSRAPSGARRRTSTDRFRDRSAPARETASVFAADSSPAQQTGGGYGRRGRKTRPARMR